MGGREGGRDRDSLADLEKEGGSEGGREGGRRTWDGGDHDLGEGDTDTVEAVDDGGDLKLVEASRDVANHRDALA